MGKIQISEQYSYVAVKRQVASAALKRLQEGKIRGAATVPANWAKVFHTPQPDHGRLTGACFLSFAAMRQDR